MTELADFTEAMRRLWTVPLHPLHLKDQKRLGSVLLPWDVTTMWRGCVRLHYHEDDEAEHPALFAYHRGSSVMMTRVVPRA